MSANKPDSGATARNYVRRAISETVKASEGEAAFVTRPTWIGAASGIRAASAKSAYRAAKIVSNVAFRILTQHVEDMRGAGRTWEEIDQLDHPKTQADPIAAYERFATPGAMPFDRAVFSWRCASCEKIVVDYGPYNGHPDDREHGHQPDCTRHAAEVRTFDQARNETDQ